GTPTSSPKSSTLGISSSASRRAALAACAYVSAVVVGPAASGAAVVSGIQVPPHGRRVGQRRLERPGRALRDLVQDRLPVRGELLLGHTGGPQPALGPRDGLAGQRCLELTRGPVRLRVPDVVPDQSLRRGLDDRR